MLDLSKIFPRFVALCYAGRAVVGLRSVGVNRKGSFRLLNCIALMQAVCQIPFSGSFP